MMMALWLGLVATLRRAWCRRFGCVPPSASRLQWCGDDIVWGVTVHCRRCWRRYSDEEQEQAARLGKALDALTATDLG